MSAKISVIISISQEIIKAGLQAILVAKPELALVAEASSQQETLEAVALNKEAVVLIKHRWLNRESCMGFCKAISETSPQTKIILLDVPLVEKDFPEFLSYGVYGYLTDTTSTKIVYLCIESVSRGGMWIGPLCETDNEDLDLSAELSDRIRLISRISPREQEVFLLLAKGFTNQGIANCLGISKDTVKTHMHNIMEKFSAGDRTQLVIKVRNELKELRMKAISGDAG